MISIVGYSVADRSDDLALNVSAEPIKEVGGGRQLRHDRYVIITFLQIIVQASARSRGHDLNTQSDGGRVAGSGLEKKGDVGWGK